MTTRAEAVCTPSNTYKIVHTRAHKPARPAVLSGEKKKAFHGSNLFSRVVGSGQNDSARPDPTRPDPTRPDPTPPDPTRPDPTRPDPTRPDPTRPDPTRPDPTRPNSIRPANLQKSARSDPTPAGLRPVKSPRK